MAAGKDGAVTARVADGVAVRVKNRANQPRELRVRGVWYRWEPAGTAGDSVAMKEADLASADFAAYAALFSIDREAGK